MSFETLTKFENIHVMIQEQKALIDLFVNTFAMNTDEATLVQDIAAMKDTFLDAASLIIYLSSTICENMASAIDTGFEEERQRKMGGHVN